MDPNLDLGVNGLVPSLALMAAGIGLGLRWPVVLLALALISLAIRPQLLWGGPPIDWQWGPHHTLMILAFVMSAWRFGLRRSVPWPIAAMALVIVLNLLFGDLRRDLSFGFMLESLVLLGLPFAFTQIDLPPHARTICAPVIMFLPLLSVALGASLQIAGLHTSFAGLHDRLEGAVGNAGVFGILAFCGLAVALHEATRQKRPWAILPTAINLALVVFSGSRAAMLASALLLVAYPLASKRFREQLRRHSRIILAGLVLAALASIPYLPTVYMRLQLKMDRWRVWNVFYDEFLKSPVFGRGFGSGLIAGVDWPPHVEPLFFPVPHNEYLHLLVNGGVIGFLLCITAILYWYYRLARSASEEDRWFLIALAPALGAFAVTDNVLIHAYTMALYVYLGLVERPSQPCSPTHHRSISRKEERAWADGGRVPPQP
ncbi:MAG: O-antigen ligase family protein [Geminicoccaceae bacterium]